MLSLLALAHSEERSRSTRIVCIVIAFLLNNKNGKSRIQQRPEIYHAIQKQTEKKKTTQKSVSFSGRSF